MITTSKSISQGLAGLTGKLPILLLTSMLAACGGGGGGNDNGGGSSSSSSSGGGSSSSSSSGGDVDTQPQAVDDAVTGDEDTDVVIDVLQNDDPGKGGISTLTVKTAPQYGQATVSDAGTPGDAGDDTIIYVPSVDFNGEDSFTYEISDTDGDVSEAAVTVTVTPTAELSASAAAGGNGTNPKMLKISWTIDVPVDHYRVEVNPDGSSGFTDSGFGAIAGNQTEAEFEVPLHLTLWEKARLQLIALDQDERIIERSNEIALDNVDTSSLIGYFKETRLNGGEVEPGKWIEFGMSIAVSADGSVMAVGAPAYGNGYWGGVYIFHKSTQGWKPYLRSSGYPLQVSDSIHISNDNFGKSVSLSADGKFLAVGVPGYGGTSSGTIDASKDHGAVFFYTYDENAEVGENWKLLWKDINPLEDNNKYGIDLDLSADGKTLAVSSGSYASDSLGRAYILKLDNEGNILTKSSIYTDEYKYSPSVSVSGNGDMVIVGSYKANSAYTYSSEDGYLSAQAVVSEHIEDGDYFGIDVEISNDGQSIAVGASGDDSAGSGVDAVHDDLLDDSGAVYVFERSESGWNQVAYVKPSHPEAHLYFGEVLAISGDGGYLAIGSADEGIDDTAGTGINPPHEGTAEDSGAVYTFHKNGNTWRQTNFVKASNTGAWDEFGRSIALSEDGSTMAVGAPEEASNTTGIGGNQEDDSNQGSGAVYIY